MATLGWARDAAIPPAQFTKIGVVVDQAVKPAETAVPTNAAGVTTPRDLRQRVAAIERRLAAAGIP
jgi:hypothetical protein